MRAALRILLATDFSDASVNAYRYSIALVAKARCEVFVAHIYKRSALKQLAPMNVAEFHEQGYEDFVKRAQKFSRLYPNLTDPHVVMRTAVEIEVTEGHASIELMEIGQLQNVDMIVIGSKEKPGIFRRIFGHLSRQLIHGGPAPVLVVPEVYTLAGPGKIALLSLDPTDEEFMSDWLDKVEVLRKVERVCCMASTDRHYNPGNAPGSATKSRVQLDSGVFSVIHERLRHLGAELVLVCTRSGGEELKQVYRNDLIHYLYDHLKVPFICLNTRDEKSPED